MKVGIPKETIQGETRVALIPSMVSVFTKNQHEVIVETGAGIEASFSDQEYEKAGARIAKNADDLYQSADLIIKVRPPVLGVELDRLNESKVLISYLAPFENPDLIKKLAEKKVTGFGMEYIPRITRAQSMDVLSSQATVVGYKAVLVAAAHIGKFFPLLMTAAGTIPPASVLILGAGVAGLQAIATAKRLGAKVEAFDPRPAVKEQVQSLGAKFVEMAVEEDVETEGGYAKEQSDAFLKKEQDVIAARLPKVDIVITTAQIFGKTAPVLITEEMVKLMKPGSVIVDIAAGQGGNCALSEPDQTVEKYGVTIFGNTNLAATIPVHASQMYSKNVVNLFNHMYGTESGELDFEDEITQSSCLTRNGEIVNETLKKAIQ